MSPLNGGIHGVFELVRVVGRALVPIAEVHTILARTQPAQSKSEMARDRFGLWERHSFMKVHRQHEARPFIRRSAFSRFAPV